LLHDFFDWLQWSWGADPNADFPMSYSQMLLASSNFWGLLEGTHLLMLMLFFGTILFVDLRLMGLTFRKTPVSVVSDKVLPLTVISMIIVVATGLVLFLSKPEEYWHNFWFRLKMILFVVAILNVFIFHKLIQKNQHQWDTAESPPMKAKLSAIISIASWCLIIMSGRFIAYNWLECGKPHADWINAFAACEVSSHGIMTLEEGATLEAEMRAADEAASQAPANDIFGSDPEPPGDEDIFATDPVFESSDEEGQ
jgi:uncharacterized membrane protein